MLENQLELPYIAVIPYHVQADTNLSDSCKLYFGQIVAFAKKTGYMWATDDQLSEMKNVSKRTIERWNNELEAAGHIRRVTANVPIKGQDGAFSWIKRRKIYFNDAFAVGKPQPKPVDPLPEETVPLETAKDGGSLDTAKNGGSLDTAKNGGINNESLDESLKIQCDAPKAVVVFPSLSKLEIEPKLAMKICREYSQPEIDIAVERCLRWKTRPNDAAGIMTTLQRAADWCDNPTPEQKEEGNEAYLLTLKCLDGKKIGLTNITVGKNYIEFVCAMKMVYLKTDDPDFKKKVVDYLEYLKRVVEENKQLR